MSKISATSAPRLFEKDASVECDAYYDTSSQTMAAQATKSHNKMNKGTFGSTSRDLPWQRGGAAGNGPTGNTPRSATPTGRRASYTTSDLTSKVQSSFGATGSARGHKGPSAAMGGGSRFMPTKTAHQGDYYTPPALGASKSATFNKNSGGTMGTSQRFKADVKDAPGPGEYSDARPGAFEKSFTKSGAMNAGFGGTGARTTWLDQAANSAASNAASHLSYDGALAQTGAFAKANQVTGKSSAAFASKSTQRSSMAAPNAADGPAPGAYDAGSARSMGATKTFNKSLRDGTGGFGSAAQRGNDLGPKNADAPGPGEYTYDATPRTKASSKPSAAFASTVKKDVQVQRGAASSGLDYDAYANDGMGAKSLKSFNKSSGGTMGTSQRFKADVKDAPGPGEYSDARPGAFEKSFTKSGAMNAGFGGTGARTTWLDQAANSAASNAASHLSYDGALAQTGAFAKANQVTGKSSAAFASKSTQRSSMAAPNAADGPAPGAYDAGSARSMGATKTFNKSLRDGTGGFGSAAQRGNDLGPKNADAPGPGEYTYDATPRTKASSKPSAAFASTVKKDVQVQRGAASSGLDYDAYANDGMGAKSLKSFNRHVGTGSFGPRAARKTHEIKETPGPGDYTGAEASMEAQKSKSKNVSGAFASTTLRDSSSWLTGNLHM